MPCGWYQVDQKQIYEYEAPEGCLGGHIHFWLTSFSPESVNFFVENSRHYHEKYVIAGNDRPYIRIENMSFWFLQVPTMAYWFHHLVSHIHIPCFVHSPKLYLKNYTHVSILHLSYLGRHSRCQKQLFVPKIFQKHSFQISLHIFHSRIIPTSCIVQKSDDIQTADLIQQFSVFRERSIIKLWDTLAKEIHHIKLIWHMFRKVIIFNSIFNIFQPFCITPIWFAIRRRV